MGEPKYTINEYGEIVREDYFFTSVKGNAPQQLPTNRKVWKILLLNVLTLGIYGLVVIFAMAKETNISCEEDEEHTRGFWGTILLSIVTLGIYSFVWYYKWANREYEYLCRHSKYEGGILSGSKLLGMMLLSFVLNLVWFYTAYSEIGPILRIVQFVWSIYIMSQYVSQHNEVNRLYNLNTFGVKE